MKRLKKIEAIIGLLVIISIALIFLSPLDSVLDDIKEQDYALPIILVTVSEVLFIAGLVIMALAVGHDIGINPLKWKGHAKDVLRKVSGDKYFWLGFWANFAGAIGTTLVVSFVVVATLPLQSWGLALVGSIDLAITLALRYEVIRLRKSVQ